MRAAVRRLFPRQVDNDYRGARAAAWLLGLIALFRLMIGFASVFNARQAASGPDGVPLDRYDPAAAQTVLSLFQLLGRLYEILPALFAILVLVRYRAMIPIAYLLLLVGQLGSRALLLASLVERSTPLSASVFIGAGLLALMVVGFALSLIERKSASPKPLPRLAALE